MLTQLLASPSQYLDEERVLSLTTPRVLPTINPLVHQSSASCVTYSTVSCICRIFHTVIKGTECSKRASMVYIRTSVQSIGRMSERFCSVVVHWFTIECLCPTIRSLRLSISYRSAVVAVTSRLVSFEGIYGRTGSLLELRMGSFSHQGGFAQYSAGCGRPFVSS